MKRFLSSLAVILLLSGSVLAQGLHWSHFESTENNTCVIGRVYLDGVELASNDYEIGAFVGDECRGNSLLLSFPQMPGVFWAWFIIYYENAGETVTFRLYRHSTGVEYDICTNTLVLLEEEVGEIDNPYIINFYSSQFSKNINAYNASNGWYLIASPLAGETNALDVGNLINDDNPKNFDLYRFNQSAELEWENWKSQEGENYHFNLESGRGYLYANSQNVELKFRGQAYTGSGEIVLSKDNGASFSGWNLVGNPFTEPAYIGERGFFTVNDTGSEIVAALVGDAIQPLEGIFVLAENNGEILNFSTEPPVTEPTLSLNISKGRGLVDRAIVRFGKGHALPKFQLRTGSTKVYIPKGNVDYAIVCSEGMDECPVNFRAESDGIYTLNFSSEEVVFNYLHLIDNMTGADIDLLETPIYNFEAKTTDYASRFKLVFSVCGDMDDDNAPFAFISNGNIVVVGAEADAALQIVDMTGRIIDSRRGNAIHHISTSEMAKGVYVLRLINSDGVKTQKIVVR